MLKNVSNRGMWVHFSWLNQLPQWLLDSWSPLCLFFKIWCNEYPFWSMRLVFKVEILLRRERKNKKNNQRKNKLPLRIIILTHRIVGHFTLGLAVVEKKCRSNCSLRNRNLIGCIIGKKSIRLRNYSKLVDTGLKSYPSKAAQKLIVTLTLAIFKLLAREWILRWNEDIFSAPAKRWVLARESWDNIYQISCFAIQQATADIVSFKLSSFFHAHKYKK